MENIPNKIFRRPVKFSTSDLASVENYRLHTLGDTYPCLAVGRIIYGLKYCYFIRLFNSVKCRADLGCLLNNV